MTPPLLALAGRTRTGRWGWHVRDLARAAARLNLRFEPVEFQRLRATIAPLGRPGRVEADGWELTGPEVAGVLVRAMPSSSLERIVFRMDALRRVEAAGTPILNPPRAIETAVDKYLTLVRLEAAGLPTPETWVGETSREALDAFDRLGGEVVVKPLFGSEGRGLIRVGQRELARRTFAAIEATQGLLYLQRFVAGPGWDVRVFVLDARVVGAIRRFPASHDWRANVSTGGTAEPFHVDAETERLAIRATEAVGARLAGVDLLPLGGIPHGWVIPEVNAAPGWRALGACLRLDVAAFILETLRETPRLAPQQAPTP